MKIAALGEFGLIDLVTKMVDVATLNPLSRQGLIIGIGDDAAAWHGDTSTQLVTTDCLVQGVHFTLETTSWEDLGWKALAVNLSDIAAMGGQPRYALVSLALPADTEVSSAVALYHGMIELAQRHGVAIIGGDTCQAPLVVITITVLGSAVDGLLTRAAAVPGDLIAVTGYLGASAAGLDMLIKQYRFDPRATRQLQESFLRPHPRIDPGQLLVSCGIKAAIDISDGLVADLGHICQESGVSARIVADRIPVHPVVKSCFGERSRELALSGGEDYELLFTGGAPAIDRATSSSSSLITVIGEIVTGKKGEVTLVDHQGNPVELAQTGWEHFVPTDH